jgi:hypothetical protein
MGKTERPGKPFLMFRKFFRGFGWLRMARTKSKNRKA